MIVGSVTAVDGADDVIRRLQQCEGLLAAPEIMDVDWLTRAADQGSIEAMLVYAENPNHVLGTDTSVHLRDPERFSEWKYKARFYLEAAADVGSVDALMALSSAYGRGDIVEGNESEGYAYASAVQVLAQVAGSEELLSAYRAGLSPAETVRGERRARQIIRRCCGE